MTGTLSTQETSQRLGNPTPRCSTPHARSLRSSGSTARKQSGSDACRSAKSVRYCKRKVACKAGLPMKSRCSVFGSVSRFRLTAHRAMATAP